MTPYSLKNDKEKILLNNQEFSKKMCSANLFLSIYTNKNIQVTAKKMETLEEIRDTKYIESGCFHTGVVPELIKQLTSNHA
jgi:hypothetical protein